MENWSYFKKWSNLQLLFIVGENYQSSIINLNDSSTLPRGWGALTNLQAINLEAAANIEYLDDTFCQLTQLIYFNCDSCQLSKLPHCFGEKLSQLRTLRLNFNKMTNNTFGNTFYMLNNTLAQLLLYLNPDLYSIPNYFKYFTKLVEFSLHKSPVCNSNYFSLLNENVQDLINNTFACQTVCQNTNCLAYMVIEGSCTEYCDTAECYYDLGKCLTDCNCDYEPYLYQIVNDDYCLLECNNSQCMYGFGNCIDGGSSSSDNSDDNGKNNNTDNGKDSSCIYPHNPIPDNYTFEEICGNICQPNWLNATQFCDTACYNHSRLNSDSKSNYNTIHNLPYCPYDGKICGETDCATGSLCNYYSALWNLWQLPFDEQDESIYITVCDLITVSLPYVEDFTSTSMATFFNGFNYDKNKDKSIYATETDAFIQYWYNITNYSAPLTQAMNAKETLYWVGPYLNLSYIGVNCVNVTRQRASQITCNNCFDGWDDDVSQYSVDKCGNYTLNVTVT